MNAAQHPIQGNIPMAARQHVSPPGAASMEDRGGPALSAAIVRSRGAPCAVSHLKDAMRHRTPGDMTRQTAPARAPAGGTGNSPAFLRHPARPKPGSPAKAMARQSASAARPAPKTATRP
ncbi:hypothetical protein [Roseicitreum antarcticum]|uniref:Uncharacterized protein n=1 Tax=Roseicitreum antarcticum TaxID=564137 RepID=A0A1H3D5W4_9RHOB|nr:hypothetical protein [Roseicitreum antarcticum]SDX61775.1 hypothetical protein SAMN04488238_1127 [Roseicitreum antarcticum]